MGRTAGSRQPTAAWTSTAPGEGPSRRPREARRSPDRRARDPGPPRGSSRAPSRARGSGSAACSRGKSYQAVPREPAWKAGVRLGARGVVEVDVPAGDATLEDPDDRGIELRPGLRADALVGDRGGKRVAVPAHGGHRLQRVADGEDPRDERDVVRAEALRVAAAVPALVVVEDDVHDDLRQPERAHDARADLRVPAHDLPLVLRERAGLGEDVLGHADLADVVQQAAEEELLGAPDLGVDDLGQLRRQPAHAAQVAARDRVLRLDGCGEALDDRAGAAARPRAVAATRLREQHGVEVNRGTDDVDVDEPAALGGRRDGGAHVVLVGVAQHDRRRAGVEDAAHELRLGRRRDGQHPRARPAQHRLRDRRHGHVAVQRRGVQDHKVRIRAVVLAVGMVDTADRDQGRVITDCGSQRLQSEAFGSDQQEIPAVRPLGHSSLWCRALGAQVNLGKRLFNVDILIFHGYLLRGTGSNVYNARLAASMSSLGARIHLFCQDRAADTLDFVDAVGDWDSGALSVRTLREPVRVTTYRPPIGRLLPVYVEDRYEGFDAKRFADCTDEEIEEYLARNVTA